MTPIQTVRFTLDPADIGILTQHSLLNTAPRRRRIHQTHFDTPEHKLADLGLAIDETRILRKTMVTVTQTAAGGHEWSAPTLPGCFDFATLIDLPDLAEQLTDLAPALIPLFNIDISQRLWTVKIRSAEIEVILEDGILETEVDALHRSTRICELELRLSHGQPAALYGVARLLSRQLRLHPIRESLTQRGLDFRNCHVSGPTKAKRIKIDPKDSVISAFKQITWQCLDHLQANEDGVFLPSNVEYIHQARVALRRLRTALRLFNSDLPTGFSDKWSHAWREVGEQLGNARNWDVFCSELLPAIVTDLGDHTDVLLLKDFAQQKRDEAHTQTQQWLRGRHYSLTVIAFCEAILTLPDNQKDKISSFADRALKRRHKRFCRGASIAHTLNGEERHEVRIDLKKLRYTLDFFESLYPQKQLQFFLGALAETQELLGHMNDLVTGEMLLALRTGDLFDLPVAWARGRMSAYLEMLPTAIKPVLEAKAPW